MLEHSVEAYLHRQTTDVLLLLLKQQQQQQQTEHTRYLIGLIHEILKQRRESL